MRNKKNRANKKSGKKMTKTPKTSKKMSSRHKLSSPRNLGRKIKNLALQTQKTVSDQLHSQTEALKSRLSAYGIGVDDVKAGAKQIEQVLKDIRSRDFLKQPGIQTLVERVTRKNVETSNLESQKMAERVPRKKPLSTKQKEKLNRQFSALSERTAQQLGNTVVQAIMKRVEEVRRSFTSSTVTGSPRTVRSEGARRKVK